MMLTRGNRSILFFISFISSLFLFSLSSLLRISWFEFKSVALMVRGLAETQKHRQGCCVIVGAVNSPLFNPTNPKIMTSASRQGVEKVLKSC
ncbi:hypothetical protein BKA56DRAFT_184645 [Ilyonectria sp. MPI-CAGE-AT-0026]|nr:hypothetical protein BKA56DRAFT_184645 [Ilyonectria sp. MPI-CAGE-AT-0026]